MRKLLIPLGLTVFFAAEDKLCLLPFPDQNIYVSLFSIVKKTIGDPSSPPLKVTQVYFVKGPHSLALALNLNLGVGIVEVCCGTAYLCGSDNRHLLVNLKHSDII